MKKKRLYIGKLLLIAGTVLLLAAGAVVWHFLQEIREEARAWKTVTTLAEDVSKSASENPATTLLKLKSSADAFDYPVQISAGSRFSVGYDRETLRSSLARYRALFKLLTVSLSDQTVKISGDRARIEFAVQYTFEDKISAQKRSDVCDVTAEMIKRNNEWKIKSLQFSKVLQ